MDNDWRSRPDLGPELAELRKENERLNAENRHLQRAIRLLTDPDARLEPVRPMTTEERSRLNQAIQKAAQQMIDEALPPELFRGGPE